MTDKPRLSEIEGRAEGATDGPWSHYGSWPFEVFPEPGHSPSTSEQIVVAGRDGTEPDSHFIAAARTDVPALTAAVRAVLSVLSVVENRSPADQWVHPQTVRAAIAHHLDLT
jgi:hypothetical protein